jgi:L-lysine 2,3-aminomutase
MASLALSGKALCRAAGAEPADWQAVLADAVRSPAELCRLVGLDPAATAEAERAAAGFPLLVPRPYLARIRPGDPADPLLLQVLPRAAELAKVPGYGTDPLGEAVAACCPGLLWKYQGRSLMVTTGSCGVHCRFCFRRHFPYQDFQGNGGRKKMGTGSEPPRENGSKPPAGEIPVPIFRPPSPSSMADWEPALSRIAAEPSIHEVILSGGDPLSLPDARLARLARRLAAIAHLRRLRLHTRLPIMVPQRITDELLAWLRGTRLSPIMVVHVNHPAEIDAAVAAALRRLVEAGVPVLSQGVLLRGVNDRAEVLAELYERLADLRVMPYYLHQLDPVAGAAHFEVPVATGITLISDLRRRLPGYAVPRYVRETRGGASKEVLA